MPQLARGRAARRSTALTAVAAAAISAVLAGAPGASAAVVDPSAYGLSAAGPLTLDPFPAVDWTAGAPVWSAATDVDVAGLHADTLAVSAGDGFAVAGATGLRLGPVTAASITATCVDGRTSVQISGSADGRVLRPGATIALGADGYVQVGVVQPEPDGSTSITALRIVLSGAGGVERIDAASARCGRAG